MALSQSELTEPELRVRKAAETGQPVDLRVHTPEQDDPAKGATWTAARMVRAKLLVKLLTRAIPAHQTPPYGVKLRGARIIGALDLEGAILTRPLLLRGCYLDEPINLREAQAPAIRLPGCHVPGLAADQVDIKGNLELDNEFTAEGEVSLIAAHIGGRFNCNGARLRRSNPEQCALRASGLTVEQDMYCREKFHAEGEVRLVGARIGGQLNCDGATFSNSGGRAIDAFALNVGQSVFFKNEFCAKGEVNLGSARIGGQLNCDEATFSNPGRRSIDDYQLTVVDMFCRRGFTAEGEVNLGGAHIGGRLNCNGASFSNRNGYAIDAYRLTVVDIFFQDGFTAKGKKKPFIAEGEVHLVGAHITGSLYCSRGCFTNRNGRAIDAFALNVGQSVFFKDGFRAEGEVCLDGAHIGGRFNCSGAKLKRSNPEQCALRASGLTVEQDMYCREKFHAEGEVRLVGARIGGQLNCDGATFSNPGGRAIDAYRLSVVDMFCKKEPPEEGKKPFIAEGEVHLVGAHITGSLYCSGGCFTNRNGRAIDAYALKVGQSVLFKDGFSAEGEVNLGGAYIGGRFNADGARFSSENGYAIDASRLTVVDMFCKDGFTAEGEVNLGGARISASLDCSGGHFSNQNGYALNFERANATTLILLPLEKPNGAVKLTNAKVGSFDDDPATWPASLYLRGFVYDSVVKDQDQVSVKLRCRALRDLDPDGYSPQPYEQLSAAYRRAGDVQAARRVAIANQWHRRSVLSPLGKLWNWLLYLTVGYGYRAWLAGLWLLAFLCVGTWALDRANDLQLLEPAKDRPAQQPTFHPAIYALDLLLPVVNLGQETAWIPRGWAEPWTWALVLAGWALTTALVAGLTNVLKRD
jgi:hypothetical protein